MESSSAAGYWPDREGVQHRTLPVSPESATVIVHESCSIPKDPLAQPENSSAVSTRAIRLFFTLYPFLPRTNFHRKKAARAKAAIPKTSSMGERFTPL